MKRNSLGGHYPCDWRGRAARRQKLLRTKIPTRKNLCNRGEAWVLQVAGADWGSGSGDLRVFSPLLNLGPHRWSNCPENLVLPEALRTLPVLTRSAKLAATPHPGPILATPIL